MAETRHKGMASTVQENIYSTEDLKNKPLTVTMFPLHQSKTIFNLSFQIRSLFYLMAYLTKADFSAIMSDLLRQLTPLNQPFLSRAQNCQALVPSPPSLPGSEMDLLVRCSTV